MIRSFSALLMSILWPLVLLVFFWVVLLFDETYHLHLNEFGIRPRSIVGLLGIVFSPFLHGGAGHLFSNSIPFLVGSGFLFDFFPRIEWRIMGIIWLFSGIGVWLYGGWGSNHIGASGVVYGLVAFLLTSGFIRRNKAMSAVSLILVFFYGSMVWGIFPQWNVDPFINISWESHLSGAITGLILAYVYRKEGPPDDVYQSDFEEEDDDGIEFGYWNESPNEDDEIRENVEIKEKDEIKIKYHFKPRPTDEEMNI